MLDTVGHVFVLSLDVVLKRFLFFVSNTELCLSCFLFSTAPDVLFLLKLILTAALTRPCNSQDLVSYLYASTLYGI